MAKKVLCYDEWSGRFFKAKMRDVDKAFFDLARLLMENGEATLNNFYDLLGLETIPMGEQFGWSGVDVQPRYGTRADYKRRPAITIWFSDNPNQAFMGR